MEITIVKSKLNDKPRYRIIKGVIENDDQLKDNLIDKVVLSYKSAASLVLSMMLKSGESCSVKMYTTDMVIPDPNTFSENEDVIADTPNGETSN